jgi:hypothetical protein
MIVEVTLEIIEVVHIQTLLRAKDSSSHEPANLHVTHSILVCINVKGERMEARFHRFYP